MPDSPGPKLCSAEVSRMAGVRALRAYDPFFRLTPKSFSLPYDVCVSGCNGDFSTSPTARLMDSTLPHRYSPGEGCGASPAPRRYPPGKRCKASHVTGDSPGVGVRALRAYGPFFRLTPQRACPQNLVCVFGRQSDSSTSRFLPT